MRVYHNALSLEGDTYQDLEYLQGLIAVSGIYTGVTVAYAWSGTHTVTSGSITTTTTYSGSVTRTHTRHTPTLTFGYEEEGWFATNPQSPGHKKVDYYTYSEIPPEGSVLMRTTYSGVRNTADLDGYYYRNYIDPKRPCIDFIFSGDVGTVTITTTVTISGGSSSTTTTNIPVGVMAYVESDLQNPTDKWSVPARIRIYFNRVPDPPTNAIDVTGWAASGKWADYRDTYDISYSFTPTGWGSDSVSVTASFTLE